MRKFYIDNIFSLYLTFVGIFWISVHIYYRLIKENQSVSLKDTYIELSFYQYFLLIGFIVIQACILLNCAFNIYRNIYNKQPSTIIFRLSSKLHFIVDILYWKPLLYIHDIIAPHIPGSGKFFLYLEKLWTSKNYDKLYFYTLIVLFDIFPKILLSFAFFYDIVILGQMKYFIFFLWIILIPLAFQIFIKLFTSFGIRNIPILRSLFLQIVGINPRYNANNEIVSYAAYQYIIKPEYASVVNAEEEINTLLRLDHIQGFGLQLKYDLDYLSIYVTFMTSIIYLFTSVIRLSYFL